MALRSNPATVKDIIDTELDDAIVDLFVDTASALVDANLLNSGLSEALLTRIETFLAAHLLTVREPQARSVTLGDESVSFQGVTGDMLKATFYGQAVLLLDTSGTLANLGKQRASFMVY